MNDLMLTLKTLACSALAVSIIIALHQICDRVGCGGY
jgi:hypothetical protein